MVRVRSGEGPRFSALDIPLHRSFPPATTPRRSLPLQPECSWRVHAQQPTYVQSSLAEAVASPLPPQILLRRSSSATDMTPLDDPGALSETPFDLRTAYENMVADYFMPHGFRPVNNGASEQFQGMNHPEKTTSHQSSSYNFVPRTETAVHSQSPSVSGGTSNFTNMTHTKISNLGHAGDAPTIMDSFTPNKLTSMDVTTSGCIVLDTSLRPPNKRDIPSLAQLKADSGYHSCSFENPPTEPSDHNQMAGPQVLSQVNLFCDTSKSETETFFKKPQDKDPFWDRFTVLPPVTPGGYTTGGESDNLSLVSYSSAPHISPSSVNFPESLSFTSRSSFSSRRGNKRALSNSPLSADGIDINSIIRMSPTSLISYLTGSRSSSSPSGCYGHLSARNSSSSPSESSGNRRSASFTPQTSSMTSSVVQEVPFEDTLPVVPHIESFLSGKMVPECENLQVLPQDLAAFATEEFIPFTPSPLHSSVFHYHTQTHQPTVESNPYNKPPPTYDQHMAATRGSLSKVTSDFSSCNTNFNMACNQQFITNSSIYTGSDSSSSGDANLVRIYPQKTSLKTHSNFPSSNVRFTGTYDSPNPISQRGQTSSNKCADIPSTQEELYSVGTPSTLHKSSDNSSSCDADWASGSNAKASPLQRLFENPSSCETNCEVDMPCRWLNCSSVFRDREDLVTHIERVHLEERKAGDDFVCFWRLCPRRLHPFNARYKLLVHMRIHSGDKPNKCTYPECKKAFSRLENLKIHVRSHTGERPYACSHSGCAKTFSNSSDRTKHQKTHHDTKPYTCSVSGCDKRYTDPSSLRKHVKKSHPDQKEPGRKKVRGEPNEVDISECLLVQGISPPVHEQYAGLVVTGESLTGSSPSSLHSSPRSLTDSRERCPANNNSLRVPVLPPITPLPHNPSLDRRDVSDAPLAVSGGSRLESRRSCSQVQQRSKGAYLQRHSSCSATSRPLHLDPLPDTRLHTKDCSRL